MKPLLKESVELARGSRSVELIDAALISTRIEKSPEPIIDLNDDDDNKGKEKESEEEKRKRMEERMILKKRKKIKTKRKLKREEMKEKKKNEKRHGGEMEDEPRSKRLKSIIMGNIEPTPDAPESAKTTMEVDVLEILSHHLYDEHHHHQPILQQSESAAAPEKKRSKKLATIEAQSQMNLYKEIKEEWEAKSVEMGRSEFH